jgi:hypothetical protein
MWTLDEALELYSKTSYEDSDLRFKPFTLNYYSL